MTRLDQLRCFARALEILEADNRDEAEALRLAYLENLERQQPPCPQLSLLASQECRG